MLKKYKPNEEIEFCPVFFNPTTKTAINHKFSLESAFQEVLYRINNWINDRSGCIVELIESQYINILTYRTLSGISCRIACKIKGSKKKKELISIKNNNQKCFYGIC